MIPVKVFYLTGLDGLKYTGEIDFYQYQGEDIFSFRFDFSGDRFDIKNLDGKWVYNGGMENHLDVWVDELGIQIEKAKHL